MKRFLLLFLTIVVGTLLLPIKSSAQELNFTAITYTGPALDANVPSVTCFETSTSSGTCSIGTNGMQEVCSNPGCYDRAKFIVNSQNNPDNTRYAVQISTSSNFDKDVSYLDPLSRTIKSSLNLADFIYKCDWEGTVLAGYCTSANITWQKYNILGLVPGTVYFLRISALTGSNNDGSFTQSAWSPSITASTQNTSISIDVDIATSTAGSSSAPFIINLGTLTNNEVTTSTNYIIFTLSTNAISGVNLLIKGNNGGLLNATSLIPNVNADLTGNLGYGLRNDSTTNSAIFSSFIGSVTVSSSPSDFQDTGAVNKVGSPTTSFVNLFTSNSLPLNSGISGYRVKAKSDSSFPSGSYSETLTYVPIASF